MNTLNHVGIIMDGNRRWARLHNKSVYEGHYHGVESLKKVIEHCCERGIGYLTVYTLSTENLKKRSGDELDNIFKLIKLFIKRYKKKLKSEGVRLTIYGDLKALPEDVQDAVTGAIDELKDGQKMTLNLALNYGGRKEILHAIKHIVQSGLHVQAITEDSINEHLYSNGQPDPDIIIRTGGNHRLSNFLTWQSVYSELFFIDTYWPDFTPDIFDSIIDDYYKEERRFGK